MRSGGAPVESTRRPHVFHPPQGEARARPHGPGDAEPMELAGSDTELELPGLGLRLPLAALYEDVIFASAGT